MDNLAMLSLVQGLTVVGNAALLAVGAIAAFAYVRYTAQGQRIANKKTQ
jgi:hypothetical protein